MDNARRGLGNILDASGLGREETPYRVVKEFDAAKLRAYHERDRREGPVLLIVAAPFKRPYIWDLLPEVSVVRRCLERGLRVYLLEWLLPTEREDTLGLADYADRLPRAALDAIEAESGHSKAVLAGHSIGGTFAAIFASLHPDRVRALALIDAPLAFGEHGGPLARAVAASPPASAIRAVTGSPVPGSVINLLSVTAAPDAFHVQRLEDFTASLFDPHALAIHIRAERWALDEFALPGQLFEETLELLYREDRFMLGTLQIGDRQTGVGRLRAPVVAVVNPVGVIVPPESILAALAAAPATSSRILQYEGDRGPMLQHVGPLVTRKAHEHLWPKILDWIGEHG